MSDWPKFGRTSFTRVTCSPDSHDSGTPKCDVGSVWYPSSDINAATMHALWSLRLCGFATQHNFLNQAKEHVRQAAAK